MGRIKLWIKLRIIQMKDLMNGTYFRFAGMRNSTHDFKYALELSQEIKKSETLESKLHNIRTASDKINRYVILPGEVFSFWKAVGNPEIGMKKSRSIVNGKLVNESGGGICQVSGILYHASIIAGLQIAERHNHSVDLYTEETRFAPLGSDATVAYGNKDLRVINNFGFPIKFELAVSDNSITVKLLSNEKISERKLKFVTEEQGNVRSVVVSNAEGEPINYSVYKKLQLLCIVVLMSFGCGNSGSAPKKDSEDTVNTIRIGSMVWSSRNLNVDTFANGDSIAEVRTEEEWIRAGKNKEAAWCYYDNDSAQAETYGRIYNWYAVSDPRGLAPKGWHVASKSEWELLMNFAGGSKVAGGKLKSAIDWDDSGNGSDDFGFAAQPNGERHVDGVFSAKGSLGSWWTCVNQGQEFAWSVCIYYFDGMLNMNYGNKSGGCAVRCLKDEE